MNKYTSTSTSNVYLEL